MVQEWNDSQPIYRQIRDRVVAMILDGLLKEGDALPSVRTVATESRVNPLTVLSLLSGGGDPVMQQQAPSGPARKPPAEDRAAAFVSVVLRDT